MTDKQTQATIPLALSQAERIQADIKVGLINEQNVLNVIDNLKQIVETYINNKK